MSYGGILTRPGLGISQGAAQADPRDRGYGATPGTAAGGGGARQPGSPYSIAATTNTGGAPSTATVLMAVVLAEVVVLLGLRRAFREYHGG
jgi:hypothetical protein